MTSAPEVLWRRDLHVRSTALAARLGDGALVVTERQTHLMRLDATTGERLWDVPVADACGSLVLSGSDGIYLDQSGRVRCFSLTDGGTRWELELAGHLGRVAALCGVVVLGGWRGYNDLQVRSVEDGDLLWRGSEAGLSQDLIHPHAFGESLLVSERGSTRLRLLDASSGRSLHEWALADAILAGDAQVAFADSAQGSHFTCGRRQVRRLDPTGEMSVVWEHTRDLVALPPVKVGEELWLHERSAVSAVDLATQRETQRVELPEGPATGVLPFRDGVLITCRSGVAVYAGHHGEMNRSKLAHRPQATAVAAPGLVHLRDQGSLLALR